MKMTEQQRSALKILGYSDAMLDRLENKEPEKAPAGNKKKKKFNPVPKKHLRFITCSFCKTTETRYYLLDEISECSWSGTVVSKQTYDETQALVGKPTNAKVGACNYCDQYLEGLSRDELIAKLQEKLARERGQMLC